MVHMFFVVKQKTAYEMRISDWRSDLCSSDLVAIGTVAPLRPDVQSAGAELLQLRVQPAAGDAEPRARLEDAHARGEYSGVEALGFRLEGRRGGVEGVR